MVGPTSVGMAEVTPVGGVTSTSVDVTVLNPMMSSKLTTGPDSHVVNQNQPSPAISGVNTIFFENELVQCVPDQ